MRWNKIIKASLIGLAFCVSACGKVSFGESGETSVHWIGRHGPVEQKEVYKTENMSLSLDGKRAMGWPGSGVNFRFKGDFATVQITDDGSGIMDLVVNGEHSLVYLNSGENTVRVGSEGYKEYNVSLTRRSEFYDTGYFEIGTPIPVTIGDKDGSGFLPTLIPERKILFLGDSITAGFGVGGLTKFCENTPSLHAPLESYAMLAANGLKAEPQLISISGRGVVHNWDGNPAPVMPAQLDFALPDRPDTDWDHDQFVPDVVVTMLGTNDWSVIDPGREKFRTGYRDMLADIRARFPKAHIVAVSGPLLKADKEEAIRDGIDWAMAEMDDENISTYRSWLADSGYIWSCNHHPGQTSMKHMANELMAHIESRIGWDFEAVDTSLDILPPPILPKEGKAHFNRRLLEIEAHHGQIGGTLLIGDSITEGWRDTPERLSLLPKIHVNQGIGWDTSSGVVRRLPLTQRNVPHLILLKIGTNDISLGRSVDEIVFDVSEILQTLRDENRQADIVLQSVLPREADKLETIAELNARYETLADQLEYIDYLDLTSDFAAPDGTLKPELTYDGLHLNDGGYAVWAAALEPYLNR